MEMNRERRGQGGERREGGASKEPWNLEKFGPVLGMGVGRYKESDPSVPCPEAGNLLSVQVDKIHNCQVKE